VLDFDRNKIRAHDAVRRFYQVGAITVIHCAADYHGLTGTLGQFIWQTILYRIWSGSNRVDRDAARPWPLACSYNDTLVTYV